MCARIVDGAGRTVAERRVTLHEDFKRGVYAELERETIARAQKLEMDRWRYRERNLSLGESVPPWIELSSPPEAPCGQAIDELIDGDGGGTCARPFAHTGRHIATATVTGRDIFGLGPHRERKDGTWVYYTPSGAARHGAETKPKPPPQLAKLPSPAAPAAKPASEHAPGKVPPATPVQARARVGDPCPPSIALDQGAGRCEFYGGQLDHLICSRPAGHSGSHLATDGDHDGAEILAFFTP